MARTFRVLLTPEEEGGFSVTVPSLPGCYTQGESVEDAINMAREAISLYVESLEAEGEPVPDDSRSLEYSIILA